MKRWFLYVGVGALVLGGQFAHASEISLADWCVNLNGDTTTACNGAGSGGTSPNPNGGSISLASFDSTLEPGSNGLGSVTVTVSPGSNYASFYSDYDVDYDTYGSFDDSIAVLGTPPPGLTYEADDPNSGNLFNDFAASSLGNFNNVGTPSGPPDECCDAAWALGVETDGFGTVTFSVTNTAPLSGFYLQQTNTDTGDSIYLSETSSLTSSPEPSTFGLGLLAIGAASLLLWKRKSSARV